MTVSFVHERCSMNTMNTGGSFGVTGKRHGEASLLEAVKQGSVFLNFEYGIKASKLVP